MGGTLRFGMHQKVRTNPRSSNRGRKRGRQRRRPPCCLWLVGRHAGLGREYCVSSGKGRLLPTAVVRGKIIQDPDSLNRIPGFYFLGGFWRVMRGIVASRSPCSKLSMGPYKRALQPLGTAIAPGSRYTFFHRNRNTRFRLCNVIASQPPLRSRTRRQAVAGDVRTARAICR